MTVYYRVGSDRVTEDEYRTKYPRLYREMQRKRKMVAKMGLEPVARVECARSSDRRDLRHEKCPYTGLDGRYMPQLARYPNDPTAVVRHVDQVEEIAKKRGLRVERMA